MKYKQICDTCQIILITRNVTKCSQCSNGLPEGPKSTFIKEGDVGDMFSETYKEESKHDKKEVKIFTKKEKEPKRKKPPC